MQAASDSKAGVIVAPAVRDLDVLAAILVAWLGRKLEGASDIAVTNLAYPRGAGQSHETILFDAAWRQGGRDHARGLVVRIKPTHTVYQDDMFEEQYRLMSVLHRSGVVPAAEPLWFEEDATVLGAPFFVMEKLAGRVAVTIPSYMETGWVVDATPAERARLWENSVRSLARLQKVPLANLAFLDRPQEGATGFDQEWERWRRFLAWISEPRRVPFLDRAYEALKASAPTNRPAGLSWGDARLGNMMVDGNFNVIAIMDLEQTSLGGALHDLGWFLSHERTQASKRPDGKTLEGFGDRAQALALWSETTGLSAADIDWYQNFATYRRSCLTVRLHDLRDQTPPGGDFSVLPIFREVADQLGL